MYVAVVGQWAISLKIWHPDNCENSKLRSGKKFWLNFANCADLKEDR